MEEEISITPRRHRCAWVTNNPLDVHYHDTEWGRPSRNDTYLFEMLVLEGMQAGLSWLTVLKKREAYRKAFHRFDIEKVAHMTDSDLHACLLNPHLIRHPGKIASIRHNARIVRNIQKEEGTLATYLWRFAQEKPTDEPLVSSTPESVLFARHLKKRGITFVGATTMHAFMQAVGMRNDHEPGCFLHQRT